MENSEQPVVAAVKPGDLLREARERLGYSPREMADRLNWLPSYLKAVEENHFDELRGDAFVRGYLRAYARQVDLPEDDIVAAYDAQKPSTEDSGSGQQDASTTGPVAGPGQTIFIGIVVALLVVAGLWWSQEQSAEQRARPAAVPVETVTEAPSLSLAGTIPEPIKQSVATNESAMIQRIALLTCPAVVLALLSCADANRKPVNDEIFAEISDFHAYDPGLPLHAEVISTQTHDG